jgi:hypothetical protein
VEMGARWRAREIQLAHPLFVLFACHAWKFVNLDDGHRFESPFKS